VKELGVEGGRRACRCARDGDGEAGGEGREVSGESGWVRGTDVEVVVDGEEMMEGPVDESRDISSEEANERSNDIAEDGSTTDSTSIPTSTASPPTA